MIWPCINSVKSKNMFSPSVCRAHFENRFRFSWMFIKHYSLVEIRIRRRWRWRRWLVTFYDFPPRSALSRVHEAHVRLCRAQFYINTYQSFDASFRMMHISLRPDLCRNLRSTWAFVFDVIAFWGEYSRRSLSIDDYS